MPGRFRVLLSKMRKASNIKQEPMTDHRNTESPDRQSEAFMQAVEKGDTHRIEELLLQEEEDRFEDELRALWNEPSGDVEAHEIEDAFRSFKRRVRPLHHLKLKSLLRHVAAAAAVIAIAVLWWQNRHGEVRIIETQWVECTVPYGQTRELTLADGTQLWLNAGSRVLYPTTFPGAERRVYVSGEVCFDVTKDPNRPFFVQADGTEIRVLGTRFNVKSYLDEPEVTTTLMSGSIEMRLPDSEETYRLTPGKTLRFNRMTGDIALFSTPEYNYPAWFRGEFNFYNMPLRDITAELERKFDVRIIIRTPEIGDLRFFAGFVNNESVDEILAALNIQKQFRIERRGDIIDLY